MPEVYGHKIHTRRLSTNIDAFQKIAENENLSKTDYRVFIFIACRLESDHVRALDPEQIAHSLAMKTKKVEEALGNLVSNGIIEYASDDHIKDGYVMSYTRASGKGIYDF